MNDDDALTLDYHLATVQALNTGRTVRIQYAPGSKMSLDGQVYELVQFHFHAPSEHLYNGQASAMELHLVHKNDQAQLAVVSVMIEPGAANPTLAEIWQHIPPDADAVVGLDQPVDVNQLLPRDRNFFHYQGSLTTPPCSESVNWVILEQPISASPQQIATFRDLFTANARSVQALHGRVIEFSH